MWYRDTRTANRNNAITALACIHVHQRMIYVYPLVRVYIRICMQLACTYVRMHRLMHVTHISSVLVQKVSVFGSSRSSKVFHLTAEEHTRLYIPTASHRHSQPPAHEVSSVYKVK